MFKDIVTSSPFVGSYTDNAFSYVVGGNIAGDVSMLSTLRALLYNRIPHDKTLQINTRSADGFRIKTAAQMFNARVTIGDYTLDVINFTNAGAAFDAVGDDAAWSEYGYKRIEKITVFFRKSFKVLCYVREQSHSTVLIIENMDIKRAHFIQCATSAFLPWFFPENKLNDLEIRLVRSLSENNAQEYYDALQAIYDSFNLNLRDEAIRRMLDGIEKRVFEASIQSLRNTIDQYERDIAQRFEAIRDRMREKERNEILLRGYLATQDSQTSNEISEYFVANKSVDIEDVSGDRIRFIPYGYLSFWDDNEFDGLVSYSYSDLYEYGAHVFSKEDKAMVMRAIFEEKVLKIKVCAAYTITIGANNGRGVTGHSDYMYPSRFNGYMKNPHIDNYNCLGNYQYSINESLASGNIIMAIEQTIMSSRSLNLSDGAVMRKFYQKLFTHNGDRFIELPDGSCVNTEEALKWLKEREGNDGQEH